MINHPWWDYSIPSHKGLLRGGALETSSPSIESPTMYMKTAYTSYMSNVNLQPCTDPAQSCQAQNNSMGTYGEGREGEDKW